MQILLAAATEMEIAPFRKSHPAADILVTGVGSPATLYHLTKRIHQIDYDLVIQAGIAGSLPVTDLGKVVLVEADTFADVGIRTKQGLSTIFEERLADPDQLPYKNGWLINDHPLLDSGGYEKVKGITVNTISDDKQYIDLLAAKYNAAIETMEGACLHYICLQEAVPFLQIRAISNVIGERDKSKWSIGLAIQNLNVALEEIFEELKASN